MANPKILDEIGSKVSELLASSPAKDLEKNARALLASGFSKLDLERRVAHLEAELANRTPADE